MEQAGRRHAADFRSSTEDRCSFKENVRLRLKADVRPEADVLDGIVLRTESAFGGDSRRLRRIITVLRIEVAGETDCEHEQIEQDPDSRSDGGQY